MRLTAQTPHENKVLVHSEIQSQTHHQHKMTKYQEIERMESQKHICKPTAISNRQQHSHDRAPHLPQGVWALGLGGGGYTKRLTVNCTKAVSVRHQIKNH
uniref:Uncharacterized protein n=1 Tax=Opuntia streptacantha TaxID=393608 RepID=A0A7C9CG86_OPUST